MTQPTSESSTYEQMLRRIEQIVQQLSAPDQDLDLVVKKVEEGYDLVRRMRERLDQTRLKVEQLKGSSQTNLEQS